MKKLITILVLVTLNATQADAASEARRKIRDWAKRLEKMEQINSPAVQQKPDVTPRAPQSIVASLKQ